MYTEPLNTELFLPSLYKTWAQKKANDFRWLEDMCDYFEYFEDTKERQKLIRKYLLNYDAYNGRFDLTEYIRQCSPHEMQWLNYSDDLDSSKIKNHSVIDTVAKSIVGEQRRRNLNTTIFNVNADSINQRKAKKIELLQAYLTTNILEPLRQKVSAQYFQENGITDPFKLTGEQQTQAKSEIDQRLSLETPKDILSYMRKDYRTAEDKQLARLYDYIRYREQLKTKTDQGFENGVITGVEAYFVPIVNREPKLRVVNPVGLKFHLAPDKMFIEDSEWVVYESYMPYTDIFNDFNLTKKEMDALNSIGNFNNTTNGYENMRHVLESRLVSVVKARPNLNEIDTNTKDGQERIKELYEKYGSTTGTVHNIRTLDTCFKSLRKLYIVERPNLKTQQVDIFYFDESYRRQPQDLSVKEKLVPEIYRVTKLGYHDDAIYVNKGPLEYQYRSLNNPFDTKMPYIGAEYSRLQGNSKNISIMDLGMPWQYRLNVELTRLDESLATDIGNVFTMNMAAIPKNWTVDQWHQFIRHKKVAPLDFSQEGLGPFDGQVFKSVDLSNSAQIAEKLAFIEYIRNQIPMAMSYNPSRLGSQVPNTPVTNNKQNIIQSSFQTEGLYSMHNIIVTNLITALLNAARIAYKDNPIKASYILDDMSYAELEIDSEMLWRSEIGVFISNDSEDAENLRITKELLQPMIQNQVIQGPEAIKLLWAKSGTDVLNIAEEGVEKMQQQQAQQNQAQIEAQERMLKMQAEIQMQIEQMKQTLDLEKQAREIQSKEFIVGLQTAAQTNQFANQYDIDKDGVNDANQREDKKLEFEREKLGKEISLQERQRKQDKELEKEKLEIERIKANKVSKST